MLRSISYDRITKKLVNTMSVIITLQRHHNYMYYGCVSKGEQSVLVKFFRNFKEREQFFV